MSSERIPHFDKNGYLFQYGDQHVDFADYNEQKLEQAITLINARLSSRSLTSQRFRASTSSLRIQLQLLPQIFGAEQYYIRAILAEEPLRLQLDLDQRVAELSRHTALRQQIHNANNERRVRKRQRASMEMEEKLDETRELSPPRKHVKKASMTPYLCYDEPSYSNNPPPPPSPPPPGAPPSASAGCPVSSFDVECTPA